MLNRSIAGVCLVTLEKRVSKGQRYLRQANGRDVCLGRALRFFRFNFRQRKTTTRRVANAGSGALWMLPHQSGNHLDPDSLHNSKPPHAALDRAISGLVGIVIAHNKLRVKHKARILAPKVHIAPNKLLFPQCFINS